MCDDCCTCKYFFVTGHSCSCVLRREIIDPNVRCASYVRDWEFTLLLCLFILMAVMLPLMIILSILGVF